MEEWIGRHWNRWVSARAAVGEAAHPAAARLAELRPSLQLLMRCGGRSLRLAEARPVTVQAARTLWHRLAGSGLKQPLAQIDASVLALPPIVALFAERELNRDLYLWWAALACVMDTQRPWVEGNAEAATKALALFPGLAARVAALQAAEALRRAQPWPEAGSQLALHEPVWTWLLPVPAAAFVPGSVETAPEPADGAAQEAQAMPGRRQAMRRAPQATRPPLLLAAKGESLKTFCDALALDRGQDDSDDGSAVTAAEEIDTPSLVSLPGRVSSRVRFDFDLPSGSADDVPVGDGFWLPEWDLNSGQLQPRRVLAQALQATAPAAWAPPPALRAEASRVRRRFEGQRAVPRWRRGEPEGEEVDLDGWIRAAADATGDDHGGLYRRRVRSQREMATLLLADLSFSTDAYANERQRVIDVIREALFVFGTALSACGDAFAITGFSSVKRRLRLHPLKRFEEPWDTTPLARLGALKPGFYTRMGAAVRAGHRELAARPERRRLLLLLTDGKPHDIDGYEGRAGLEDTRQAVREARQAGLLPFAITIDAEAAAVMPLLFGDTGGQRGQGGWACIRRPQELPRQLAALYGQLLR